MAKKKQVEPPMRTALVVTKKEFGSELTRLIEQGTEIHTRQIINVDELSIAKRDYSNWIEVADEFLKSAFNNPNNEYRQDFEQDGNAIGLYDALNRQINTNHPFYQLGHLQKKCDVKVNNLKTLLTKTKYMASDIETFQANTKKVIDDSFSVEEKNLMNKKIDLVLSKVHELHLGQEVIFNEIEELKSLMSLGKKNWKQVLKGKLVDLGLSKVIDTDTLEWIYNMLTDESFKLIGS